MSHIRLTIVPLGKVDPGMLEYVRKGLRLRFKIPVQIGNDLRAPEGSFNGFRKQYEANLILNDMEKNFDDKVLAITNHDIYTAGLNFIFGLAKTKSKSAIVSTYRLDPQIYNSPPNIDLLKERLLKECIHEFGHTLGMQHCREQGCIMNASNNIRDIDNKSTDFCHMCQIQLER